MVQYPKKRTWTIIFVFGLLLVLNILAWSALIEIKTPPVLGVVFFDVGQGDAIFINTPSNHTILIDGGPDSTILEKLSLEIPFWSREIDLIVLTHSHADHLVGLLYVLENYKVENILWTGAAENTAHFRKWLSKIEGNYNVKIAQAGQRIKSSGWYMDVLYPFDNLAGQNPKDSNNASIVLRLVSNQKSFLFTGDIYDSVEKQLVDYEKNCLFNKGELCDVIVLDSDVLKIGHHGSRTSSSKEFLEKVLPSMAVISLGENNRYGHPHKEVLERLLNYDIKILRTDQEGDIKIKAN